MNALYEIKLDIDSEQKAFLKDAIKVSTIYLVALFLHCSIHAETLELVTKYSIEIFCLILLGVAFYHLVVNLLFQFT